MKMVLLVMEALEAILKVTSHVVLQQRIPAPTAHPLHPDWGALVQAGSHGNVDYKKLVDEAGGIDALESLQEHENYVRAAATTFSLCPCLCCNMCLSMCILPCVCFRRCIRRRR